MFGREREVYASLVNLRDEYGVTGIKAEFEAEGASYADLVRLRRLTLAAGIKLYLKIGGVEAVRDIRDSLEIGVDGLVAPMVESPFGLKKFLEAYASVYGEERIALSINIETKGAVEQLDGILALAKGRIDDVTIGRTDLSASYMDPAISPDTDFIMGVAQQVASRARDFGVSATLGGSICAASIELLKARPGLAEKLDDIETRKVIIPRALLLKKPEALREALRFEEEWILSRKECTDLIIAQDMKRLEKLQARL